MAEQASLLNSEQKTSGWPLVFIFHRVFSLDLSLYPPSTLPLPSLYPPLTPLLQLFMRDAKQCEQLLSTQNNVLSKDEVPVSILLYSRCFSITLNYLSNHLIQSLSPFLLLYMQCTYSLYSLIIILSILFKR